MASNAFADQPNNSTSPPGLSNLIGWTLQNNFLFPTNPGTHVGIGTATPSEALEVVGNAKIDGTLKVGNGNSFAFNQVMTVSNTGTNFDEILATTSVIAIGGTTSSAFPYTFSPNIQVGIGTQAPTNTLDVVGTARVRTLLAGNSTMDCVVADPNGVLHRLAPGTGTCVGGGGATDHHWDVVNNNVFSGITGVNHPIATGNVGIGTTNPLTKLQVTDYTVPSITVTTGAIGLPTTSRAELGVATLSGNYSSIATPGDVVLRAVGGSTQDLILATANSNNNAIRFSTGTTATESEKMTILENGNVGIGINAPTAKFHVTDNPGASGNGNVLFEGQITAVGNLLPTTNSPTRMMWIPSKAALRAGTAQSSEWDAVNIGVNSIALGQNTQAKGPSSTAMGEGTEATGNASTAMGYLTKATNDRATAMGYNTKATNVDSTSMGVDTIASGAGSTAMGGNTKAIGNYSTTMGHSTTATKEFSTAMGAVTTADGYASTSMGKWTTAKGDFSTAMGYDTNAIGYASTAMGADTNARGDYSTAMGKDTNAWGDYSTAMGAETDANGPISTAMGYRTIASGPQSTAMGHTTRASGGVSTAMGHESLASGDYSVAIGLVARAEEWATVAIGNYAKATMGQGNVALGNFIEASGNVGGKGTEGHSFVIGRGVGNSPAGYLVNNIPNSLMIGFNSTTPTLFVGTLGNVRIQNLPTSSGGSVVCVNNITGALYKGNPSC